MGLRSPRARRWVIAAGAMVAGVAGYRALDDPWPARPTLKSPPGERLFAFSPDGASLITSADPAGVAVWDVPTGRRRDAWTIPGGGVVVCGAYSPDGVTFAAIVRDNNAPARLVLIDVATGQVRGSTATRHDRDAGFGYVADGSAIVFGSANGSGIREVIVFDAATGRELSATRPAPPIAGSAVAMSADARSLAYFPGRGGPITLEWVDPGPRRPVVVASPTGEGATGAFDRSPDGRRCAIGRLDGTIELWDLAAGRLEATFRAHSGLDASAGLRFGPDGRTLTSWGLQLNGPVGLAQTLKHELGRLRDRLRYDAPPSDFVVIDVATGRVIRRSIDPCYLLFAPGGRAVATADRDQRIRLRATPGP